MAPIRVGIVGLRPRPSGDLTPSNQPGYWASVSHLPALRAIPEHYEIVAVCNSSTESANEAIKQFDLPESTKAYGSAEDLANDSSVDLVVVCVGVGKHFKLAKLALEKKSKCSWNGHWVLGFPSPRSCPALPSLQGYAHLLVYRAGRIL
ncbi:putative oxidoreductase family protein [Rosellinia necatrix]|uniref:Putative oxidoreductase family protein n=1 Tax=Rosellinia necatrix TaxID=77044 RepID=A0A1S7UIS4_ROSNE|nr:putative oxidoreductase family protein [Rosellinia necatrix]